MASRSIPIEAAAAGPDLARPRVRWDRLVPLTSAVGSVALTALMSVLWNGEVRRDMIVTGLVCGIVIERLAARITRHYRRRLAHANAVLECRVRERTADLAAANASLLTAAAAQESLRNELLVRDRLATAGMLAAGVSHEIRSPLQVITLGMEELHAVSGDRTEDEQAIVADVRTAAAQIGVVVRDLASLARPAVDAVGPVALAPVIDSAVRLASYQLGRGVTITRGPLTDVPVAGNDSRLVQVILNLLTNAARATPPGRTNTIAVGAEARGDGVVITVADTGTGMTPETQARLFQPFFTTGRERGGTGLGLSICRSIVERLGGTIEIASTLDVGTTVEVRLRRAA